MSTEITGGLIQMTAHMVVTDGARGWMIAGAIVAALFGFLALCAAVSRRTEHKRRYVLIFLAFALAGAAMLTVGAKQPRRKVLYCCADGPVDLQMVAARYDIVDVDGKLLTLMER